MSNGSIFLGVNDRGYRLGNVYEANVWSGYNVNPSLGVGLHIQAKGNDHIQGEDAELVKHMSAGNDPRFQAKFETNFGIGVNFLGQKGALNGQRFALEWLMPIYQYSTGVRLKKEPFMTVGWQYAWK